MMFIDIDRRSSFGHLSNRKPPARQSLPKLGRLGDALPDTTLITDIYLFGNFLPGQLQFVRVQSVNNIESNPIHICRVVKRLCVRSLLQ